MPSAKGKIIRLFGSRFLPRATVVQVEDLGTFRKVVMHGDFPSPGAGTKVQLLLPSDDTRTYSPIASPGGMTLLGWKEPSGPGGKWMNEVRTGAELLFAGPQSSLSLPGGPVIVVGDETSIAVAASFEAERPGQVRTILQVGSVDDARRAATAVGLALASISSRGDTAAVVNGVLEARASAPGVTVALTGGSQFVLAVRSALRERGVADIKTKTYWIPGKSGLD